MKPLPLSSILVIVLCAALTLAGWSHYNQPIPEPAYTRTIQGLAFSPYRKDQDGIAGIMPTVEAINADLALLTGQTRAVRTYTTEGVFYEIPRLAARHNINVTVGAWIDTRDDHNRREIQRAEKLADQENVTGVIIGNEVLLRNEIPVHKLTTYLDQAREAIAKPVSTAETWSTWMQYPELADHVDFIAVHILPYWEGIGIAAAVEFTADRMKQLRKTFPGKPVVIAEVGWPSEGRTRYDAVASVPNQATFLRRFLQRAEQEGYAYFLMEAFDQPWKRGNEGAVGAYWGIYDVERQAKFSFDDPIVKIPEWQTLASVSITIGILLISLFYSTSRTVNTRGKTVLAVIIYGLTALVSWLVYDYAIPYMTATGIITGVVLVLFMLGMVVLLLSETHEWIEAHWVSHRARSLRPHTGKLDQVPMVSIHVPAYNEPPDMLIHTLNALALLDYPHYEVIVVDNNTKDEKIWRPVEEHCRNLGDRFHFYHVDPLTGFKAGALNYALRYTDKAAELIAVIDSDYVVDKKWLRDLVPSFNDPAIAIVQAPQDYRDGEDNTFKAMCYAEYQGFFQIGMVTRNERNAIIQHGTMTMIRRSTLKAIKGWAEWCITEDTELGLRIFEQGMKAAYTPHSYGRGLIPDTFMDYKKQRYRWAYGAMQIMKRHLRELLHPDASRLSMGQRYHFIAGWLPWLAQSANLVFSVLAIAWSVGMMYAPAIFEAPHLAFSIFPIMFFSFNLVKHYHLYRYRLGKTPEQTLAAAIAGLSLSHTIGKAILYGLFTSDQPFVRTPKQTSPHVLSVAMASAFEETLLFATFMLAILTLTALPGIDSPDFTLWLTLLTIQSIPYAAALITSLISACLLPTPVSEIEETTNTRYSHETNKR